MKHRDGRGRRWTSVLPRRGLRRALLSGGAVLVGIALAACSTSSAWVAGTGSGHHDPHSPLRPVSPSPTPTPTSSGASASDPDADSTPSPTSTARPTPVAPPTATAPSFDKSAASVDDPASIWVIANKSRALNPPAFVPPSLRFANVPYVNRQPSVPVVASALEAMFAAGKSEAGLSFSVQSAYRSYDSQVRVYDEDVAEHGVAYADTDTARPGHSEHQTGLAVDISAVPAQCSLDACFAHTPQGMWLAANAYRFGFLLRYPADKVAVTGFTFEPWHFRYIGPALALELHTEHVSTLEEFFGVPGGTQYH